MTAIPADLHLFVAVVEAGSFSAAGRALGLVPSSVARRVEALERDLGAKLLNRTTRRLGLTEAGSIAYERGQAILRDAQALRGLVGARQSRPSGLLRISASTGFGRRYVAPCLGDFRRAYPEVTLDLRLEDDFVDLVGEGVDVAVRVGRLADSGLRHLALVPVRRRACASPAYLDRRPTPLRPQDLMEHDCVVVGGGVGTAGAWRFARTGPLRPPRTVRVNTPEVALAAALGGAGVAHLPSWLVDEDLRAGRLTPLLAAHEAPAERGDGVHLLWPEHPPAKTIAFVDFLKTRLAALAS